MKQWDSMRIELEILMQKQKRLLSSRRGQRQLQAMMHGVELTDEQLAYMCHAHEVNISEAFDNWEDWQAHYGDVRGSIPMEQHKTQEYRVGTFGTLAHDTSDQAVILVFPQYLGDETASLD